MTTTSLAPCGAAAKDVVVRVGQHFLMDAERLWVIRMRKEQCTMATDDNKISRMPILHIKLQNPVNTMTRAQGGGADTPIPWKRRSDTELLEPNNKTRRVT